ncbi:DUF3472 domain-containing protein [Sphingobacterium spiritivorum]|uniref:DUF3472 domain-containing protein n=1 Tax=Sphingobacterium spiritivorum TaxID=258 RepID=UPI003DA50123
MKKLILFLFLGPLLLSAQQIVEKGATKFFLPVAGNTWQYPSLPDGKGLITDGGIQSWNDPAIHFKTFVRFAKKGDFDLNMIIDAVNKGGEYEVSIGQQKKKILVKNTGAISLGHWTVKDSGYYAVVLKALSPKANFAAVKGYEISGTASFIASANFVPNNEGNFFYWGRRGPSVHLGYNQPEGNIEYYYNEVTVGKGNDVEGSYYMANGFSGGYFGMQVNSKTERRILFSVWSPFTTDDPKSIPDDHKIILKAKGEGVYTGEFGNEGSGGQSFLRYNWITGNTYKFLLRGRPVANDYTEYTAWFYAPEKGKWQLIAQFERPKTNTYLKGFHSFLENFNPNQGIYERIVKFDNQWVRDQQGNWVECTKAKFTADQTARKGYRLDYAGGVANGAFYLRNCGFFNNKTVVDSRFERPSKGKAPQIDLDKLPVK